MYWNGRPTDCCNHWHSNRDMEPLMDDPNIELWKQIRGDGEEYRWGPEDDPYEDKYEIEVKNDTLQ
ncbi:MAG: hypothetical protein KAS32_10560 [Candidatus Peribacteraceae bacterium]|nr:hypothetical protein [Candidatus Peribacteraceae bacterium]